MRYAAYLLALFLYWLVPTLSLADSGPGPALYDVVRVALDDVLNVRDAPDPSASQIGALAHDATGVEVFDTQQGWARINLGERSGWASLAYLDRQDGGDYIFTKRLNCFGTEPFWSLEIVQGQSATFTRAGEAAQSATAGLIQMSLNRRDRFQLRADSLIAVLSAEQCNDGMSDRGFGLSVDVFPDIDHHEGLYSGCCSLVAD